MNESRLQFSQRRQKNGVDIQNKIGRSVLVSSNDRERVNHEDDGGISGSRTPLEGKAFDSGQEGVGQQMGVGGQVEGLVVAETRSEGEEPVFDGVKLGRGDDADRMNSRRSTAETRIRFAP